MTVGFLESVRSCVEMLRSEDRNAPWLPPVILEFWKVFGNPVWLSRMLTGDLSPASEEIDIPALCEHSLERISGQVGTKLSLTVAAETAKVPTDEYVLRQALDALFRNSYSAFRTTAFELSQRPPVATSWDEKVVLILALREPVPNDFSPASDLVRIHYLAKRPVVIKKANRPKRVARSDGNRL